MRKLLKITTTFALALVFTAGMAFGQQSDDNEATVNQDGNGSEATITQTSGGVLNSATVSQNGTFSNHVAKITQNSIGAAEGNANEADVDQFRQAGYSSEAYIKQGNGADGAGNVVNLKQSGNTRADVTQKNNNTLEGYFGETAIQTSPGSKSTIDVSQGRGGDNRTVGVDQRGAGHEVTATQTQGSQNAQFLQRGSDQTAQVTQRYLNGYDADVRQFGSSNEAYVAQGVGSDGPGIGRSEAFVEQDGIGNRADVVQNGGLNDADVTQSGNHGEVMVNQTGGESVVID